MAGGAGRARDRFAQAFSRNRSLANRNFFPALADPARRAKAEALLCDRVGRNRDRFSGRGGASRRARLAHSHPEPDGILEQTSPPPGLRKTVSSSRRWSSGGRRARARYSAQTVRRDQLFYCLSSKLGSLIPTCAGHIRPGQNGPPWLQLKCEPHPATHHPEIVLLAVDHVPTEIVDDADVRGEAKFH